MKESYQRMASSNAAATFMYDAVFGPEGTNENVYKAFAQERVLSAMQVGSFDVTILDPHKRTLCVSSACWPDYSQQHVH